MSNYINQGLLRDVNEEVAMMALENGVPKESAGVNGDSLPQMSVFEGNSMLDAFCLYEEAEFDFMQAEPSPTGIEAGT